MDILITTLSLISPPRFCRTAYNHPVRDREKNGNIHYVTPRKRTDENKEDHYELDKKICEEDGSERIETIEIEPVRGNFTNEAPTKYLLNRKMEESYSFFDKIIILGTRECQEDKIGDLFEKAIKDAGGRTAGLEKNKENAGKFLNMTTLEYYEWMILDHIRHLEKGDESEEGRNPEDVLKEDAGDLFIFLNVDKLDSGKISEEIQKQSAEDAMSYIYMDYTGGTRVTSLIAMMLCRWLEVRNYRLECAVYCDINNRANTVRDITDVYGMFDTIIAHDKIYDPAGKGYIAENRDVSVSYGIVEYREKFKKQYIKPAEPGKPFVFISYSHMDYYPCQAIIERLKSWGYRIWYDEGIGWGDYWEDTLKKHMDQCEMAIVLLSDNYLESDYCRKELEALSEKEMFVIRLGNVSPGEDIVKEYPFLEERQGIIRLKNNRNDFYRKLEEGMEYRKEAAKTRTLADN